MKKKRFNHHVETLCQIFCGWRLANSHATLTHLGSGDIKINLLTKQTVFNSQPIDELNIAHELYAWFYEDLAQNNIYIQVIKKAEFNATLCIRKISGKRKTKEIWTSNIKEYISCDINCNCILSTDEAEYKFSLTDTAEWPDGWWKEKRVAE